MNDFLFSVPHTLDIVGERFEAFGLSPLVAASTWRLRVAGKRDASGEGGILVPDAKGRPVAVPERTREALGAALDFELPPDLKLVAVNDEALPDAWAAEVAHAPAFAVGAVTAAAAVAGRLEEMPGSALAAAAARMMRLSRELPADALQFESACSAAVQGGVSLIATEEAGENFAELMPPECLLLVFREADEPERGAGRERLTLARFMAGHAAEPQAHDARTLESVMADPATTETEKLLLYASVRVRDMLRTVADSIQRRFIDNDVLGEMMEDESDLLVDYLGLDPGALTEARDIARDGGALGGKYLLFSGSVPAMLVLAPNRTDEVRDAMEKAGYAALPAAVATAGLSALKWEETEGNP